MIGPRLGIALAALCAAVGPAACGEADERREVNAEALLDSAFAQPPASATTKIEAAAAAGALPALPASATLSLDGPYVSGGGVGVPSFDWAVEAEIAGFGVEGELVSTGDNVYLSIFGDNYQVGRGEVEARAEALANPEIEPRSWFGPARYVGDEEVEGTQTARIDAPLRGARFAADLEQLAARLGLPPLRPAVEGGTARAWIGIDDELLRELRVEAGEELAVDVVLSDLGEPQEITIPPGGGFKPLGELLSSLQELGISP